MSATDETRAIQALAYRLRDWDVPDADDKARGFIEALVNVGWEMGQHGARPPRPLKPHEACTSCGRALHRPDDVCGGRPEPAPISPHIETVRHLVDLTRRNLCSHGVDPALCIDHRPAKGATTPQPEAIARRRAITETEEPGMSVTPYDKCCCVRCGPPWRDDPNWTAITGWQAASWMALCPTCGDKRCSGALDHERHPTTETEPTQGDAS